MTRRHQTQPLSGVVVISGASSGIGRASALHLVDLGYTVVAGIRQPAAGEALKADSTDPERMIPAVFDVTNADQLAATVELVEQLVAGGARFAGVFSNAGIASYSGDISCEGTSPERLEHLVAVNYLGAVRFIQSFLPLLRASQGTVVVNSAMMTRMVLPFNGGYAPSKSALETWTTSLRREIAPYGVKVVTLQFAEIVTPLGAKQDTASVPAGQLYPGQRVIAERMAEMITTKASRGSANSPEAAAALVGRAMSAKKPRVRYIGGGGSRPLALLSELPLRVQDALVEKMIAAGVKRLDANR